MKRKWYRSNGAKVFWIAVAMIAAIASAICVMLFVLMYDAGFRLQDQNKSYEQTERFSYAVRSRGTDILNRIGTAENNKLLSQAGEDAVIDLDEFTERGSDSLTKISFENTSGLAYAVEDLLAWSKDWEGRYEEDSQADPVITCEKADGSFYYYYYEDFKQQLLNSELEIEDPSYLDYYEYTETQTAEAAYPDLFYDIELGYKVDLGPIRDTHENTLYTACQANPVTPVEEKYPPEGADSLLEVLNTDASWNGRLEEAYEELNSLLSYLQYYAGEGSSPISFGEDGNMEACFSEDYQEGNTNLTYLYADKDTETIYTNKAAYQDFDNLDEAIKEMQEEGSYIIIYPADKDCATNIPYLKDDGVLQLWSHSVREYTGQEDYVYALQVDTAFPAEDTLAEDAAVYEQYRSYFLPVTIGGGAAILLLVTGLVWLTFAAGRRPGDEEVHLNAFDRWFTEIGAAAVIGVWGGPIFALGLSITGAIMDDITEVMVFAAAAAALTALFFLIGYLSLVRRIKARTLWKNSLLRHLFRLLGKGLKSLKNFLGIYSKNTSAKLKMSAIVIIFLGMQFLFCAIIFSGGTGFLLLLAFFDAAALVYLIRRAGGWDIILDGLKRISGGELQHKISTERLLGDQKTMAEYINNIGSGLDAAVEKSVKNERMKTELITNVSHDIKTPLTSIINYVDLLKRENPTDPKIQGYLKILEEKSQRLKTLTEDVVEASKASSGNITLEMNDLDFVEMVQQVIGEFEERFQEKNLVMMVHFTDEPSVIYADGQRMWRVLENIFGNVVKYAMEGTRVYAEVLKADKKITFSLKNISAQPLNISPEELTERFIRGDVSRNTEGSGLGLSIAKSLTELQGGEFKLYLDGDLFKVMITFAARTEKTQI